jgi:pilus assembly protein Flp/PilA
MTPFSVITQCRLGLQRYVRDETGATAIEYGLMAGLIAAACIGAFSALGGTSGGSWNNMASKVSVALGN